MKKNLPSHIDINLLPRDPFFESGVGRVLQWALSAGRYIVIFTELVVILSFVSRFWLDRQLTDLNTRLSQQKNIIASFGDLEPNFRLAQKKIEHYQQVHQSENITEVFAHLTEVTPLDVSINQLSIKPASVVINGVTLSQTAFNLLINNLQLSPHFHNVTVNKVEANDNEVPGFKFSLNADTRQIVRVTTQPNQTPERIDSLNRTQGL